MNKILDKIISFLIIIWLIFIITGVVQEVIINLKIIKEQDNCIKINGVYYCEVENE